jgi:hypothetical protein
MMLKVITTLLNVSRYHFKVFPTISILFNCLGVPMQQIIISKITVVLQLHETTMHYITSVCDKLEQSTLSLLKLPHSSAVFYRIYYLHYTMFRCESNCQIFLYHHKLDCRHPSHCWPLGHLIVSIV